VHSQYTATLLYYFVYTVAAFEHTALTVLHQLLKTNCRKHVRVEAVAAVATVAEVEAVAEDVEEDVAGNVHFCTCHK
jgi:hypothetical protein